MILEDNYIFTSLSTLCGWAEAISCWDPETAAIWNFYFGSLQTQQRSSDVDYQKSKKEKTSVQVNTDVANAKMKIQVEALKSYNF